MKYIIKVETNNLDFYKKNLWNFRDRYSRRINKTKWRKKHFYKRSNHK